MYPEMVAILVHSLIVSIVHLIKCGCMHGEVNSGAIRYSDDIIFGHDCSKLQLHRLGIYCIDDVTYWELVHFSTLTRKGLPLISLLSSSPSPHSKCRL